MPIRILRLPDSIPTLPPTMSSALPKRPSRAYGPFPLSIIGPLGDPLSHSRPPTLQDFADLSHAPPTPTQLRSQCHHIRHPPTPPPNCPPAHYAPPYRTTASATTASAAARARHRPRHFDGQSPTNRRPRAPTPPTAPPPSSSNKNAHPCSTPAAPRQRRGARIAPARLPGASPMNSSIPGPGRADVASPRAHFDLASHALTHYAKT